MFSFVAQRILGIFFKSKNTFSTPSANLLRKVDVEDTCPKRDLHKISKWDQPYQKILETSFDKYVYFDFVPLPLPLPFLAVYDSFYLDFSCLFFNRFNSLISIFLGSNLPRIICIKASAHLFLGNLHNKRYDFGIFALLSR